MPVLSALPSFRLDGRRALVTGAGRGIGEAAAKAMAASGIVWDDANLGEYLERPAAFLKGNKMAFAGMRKDTDRADVIAYIKDASK